MKKGLTMIKKLFEKLWRWYAALADFLRVLEEGAVTMSLKESWDFRYDRMHQHGWNYYVFHFGPLKMFVSGKRAEL